MGPGKGVFSGRWIGGLRTKFFQVDPRPPLDITDAEWMITVRNKSPATVNAEPTGKMIRAQV
jgi:hypothetical protein